MKLEAGDVQFRGELLFSGARHSDLTGIRASVAGDKTPKKKIVANEVTSPSSFLNIEGKIYFSLTAEH